MLDEQALREALRALGDTLADRGQHFHVAIVGGAALLMQHGTDRSTQDVDVIAVASGDAPLRPRHQLPPELAEAAEDVAVALDLDRDWFNAGALGVLSGRLPEGYETRLNTETFGNLIVSSLSRQDLIRLKLYAAIDEGPGSVHVQDLVEMSITPDELEDAAGWVADLYPARSLPELEEVVTLLRELIR